MTSAGETATDPAGSAAAGRPAHPRPGSGPGAAYVGAAGVTFLACVVLALLALTVSALIAIWPPSPGAVTTPSHVLGLQLVLGRDQRLFIIVALAGGLGGLIHSGRSLYEYTGNRILRRSWLLMYLSLPFIGSALAVVFYVILRGGLITGSSVQVNFFGFAAVAALVGLFSPEAMEKLKQVFSTILAPAQPGEDHLPAAGPHGAAAGGAAPAAGEGGAAPAPESTAPPVTGTIEPQVG